MSMHGNDPQWIRSPWPDDISEEMAEILCNTFQALAMACDEHYCHQLHSYYATRRAALCDPQRPWMRKPVEPDHVWSRTEEEARAAYLKARQLDLFDSSAGWEDAFGEDDF